jgi:hypothetical protein
MASPQEKQGQIITAITNVINKALETAMKPMAESQAEQMVLLNTIIARMDMLESLSGGGAAGAATKRAVRTTPAKPAAASSAKGGAKASPSAKPPTNSLLYFRYALKADLEQYRETYAPEEIKAEAASDPAVAKKDEAKNPEEYWGALSQWLWKNKLSEDNKTEVKRHFEAYKNEQARAESAEALEEDQ